MVNSKSTSTHTVTISKHVLFLVLNICVAAVVFFSLSYTLCINVFYWI